MRSMTKPGRWSSKSWNKAREFIAALHVREVADIETAWHEAWRLLAPSRAAQCALDIALWDWLAHRRGVTAAELAWGEPPRPVQTFATIGLSTPEELAAKIEELHGFPWIKIKSDAAARPRRRSGACGSKHPL